MIDRRDFMNFLLGVFCGQTAALPTTATFSRQQFLVLVQTLLPKAGITEQTICDVMALQRENVKQSLRQAADQTVPEKEGMEVVCDYWFAGNCLGFLIGRNIQSGDWIGTLQLSDIALPRLARNRPYSGVHFRRAVRRLKRNQWVEVDQTIPSIVPAATMIRLTPPCQAALEAALALDEVPSTAFVSRAAVCQ